MVTPRSNGCRTSRSTHQRGHAAPVMLLVAGLTCWFQFTGLSPLSFAAPATGAVEVVEAPQSSAEDRAERLGKAFYGSSRFLKVLLSNEDMHHLGNVKGLEKIEEKTGASIRCSKKGDYYPWAKKPFYGKVLVIGGEEQAVADAWQTARKILTKEAPRRIFQFLIPENAQGILIGLEGEKISAFTKGVNATISLQNTPYFETQVIMGSENPEAADQLVQWLLEEQKGYIEDMRQMLHTSYQAGDVNRLESSIYITLSDEHVAQLIGKGGAMRDHFRRLFRVNIRVDQKNRGPKKSWIVQISGLVGDIHAAHKEILERFVAPTLRPRRASPEEAAALLDGAASSIKEEPIQEVLAVEAEAPAEAAKA